jgi:hypothetical protein
VYCWQHGSYPETWFQEIEALATVNSITFARTGLLDNEKKFSPARLERGSSQDLRRITLRAGACRHTLKIRHPSTLYHCYGNRDIL